jgi:hypothetical protein
MTLPDFRLSRSANVECGSRHHSPLTTHHFPTFTFAGNIAMTVRIAAITGLCLSAFAAAGCQNAAPNLGQAPMGAGMFGPHVTGTQQTQYGADPFLNADQPQGAAMNSGHVRVAGVQQPPPGQATSNVSPTIIQAGGIQQPVMPAGYRQPAGPFNQPATMPVGAGVWQQSQPAVYSKPY